MLCDGVVDRLVASSLDDEVCMLMLQWLQQLPAERRGEAVRELRAVLRGVEREAVDVKRREAAREVSK